MRVRFWGVRGSIPTPLSTEQLHEKLFQALSGAAAVNLSDPAEVQAYIARLPPSVRSVVGGNTTCVEIDSGDETIIIDCGSGMRPLGYSLMAREFGRGKGVAHIFLTHAHWDHLQGYPFFLPAYVPGNKLIFYAVNYNPQHYLEHQQVAPMYFPIPPNAMRAEKEFIRLREGETVQIGRTLVSSLALYHPGTAYAYRFDDGKGIFVFASDGEYKSLAESSLRHYINFYLNADALVFDSQYSLRDVFLSKADWGHSSAIIGVDIAERAQVKRLITFHHDPTHSDEQVYAIAASAREYASVNELHSETEVVVGTEGLELFLGEPMGLEMMEERANSVWTLVLAGRLNAATAAEAQKRLRAMLSSAPEARLILDLTLLSMADAIGVKGLLDVMRAHPNAQLAVLVPGASIRRVFDQTGASEAFQIFRNRQQAMTALIGPAHLRLASEVIGQRYQVDELLFADEAGVMYRGTDRSQKAPVLVRVVPGSADEPARAEFAAQIEAWQKLQHPGLLPGKAIIAEKDWIALVFAWPGGVPLREWRAQKSVNADLWRAAAQLCEAVMTVHAQSLVHGDLRPESIAVHGAQAFIARLPLFPNPPEYSANAYRAPEQLRGQPITARTDVYTLGMILYELFLGAHPFTAETEALRLTLQLYSQPQSPRMRWPEIPAALEGFLLKMLAVEPEERFASGKEVLEAYTKLTPESGPGR